MSDFALISQAIPQVFTLYNMLLIFGGLVLGMVIGCVPGLSVTLGIILMLPLTYTFDDPASAIILLLAVYVGGMYGGSISAITLNTPGTNSAIATTFDGYPLAKKGKVKKALDTSLFASVFGGLFSAVLLLLCASLITKLVANFTSVEYFSLGIMGISLIAGVSGSSLPKSLISGMIGLLMACIGMDAVTGVTRFSFGSATLKYGIDMLPAMIALIALTQVVQKLRDFKVSGGKLDDARKIDKQGITKKETISILPACLRSSAIASVLGAMPGVGGGVAQFLCYNEVRRTSKHPEEFGKGCLEGIAAAESSNNAVVGSAMIPLLTLGIPGDGVTALLLGAFVLHGIQPGPTMFTKQGVMAYTIIIGCLVANVLLAPLGLGMTRIVAKIVQVRYTYLAPVIIMFCFAGAFAATGNTKELIICAGILIFSYILTVLDIDNTLTADRSQELPEEVAGWLDIMRRAGVKLTIVSNGAEKRVRPFAQKLGLAYLYRSAKPLPFALIAAQHRMGVKRRQMAMVGDQLYADRMAAALYGIPGLMVVPRGPDLGAQVILKRKWEKKHWQKYYDRGGRTL